MSNGQLLFCVLILRHLCSGLIWSVHTLLFLVPTTIDLIGPVTNNLMVGDPLTLQCVVNTVENIMSSVDIVWRSDGELLERNNSVTGNDMNGSVVYSDSYTFEALTSSDNRTLVDCEVVINVEPPIRNTSTATEIIVFGKYSSIVVC